MIVDPINLYGKAERLVGGELLAAACEVADGCNGVGSLIDAAQDLAVVILQLEDELEAIDRNAIHNGRSDLRAGVRVALNLLEGLLTEYRRKNPAAGR